MPTLADTGTLTPEMIDAIKRFLAQPPSYAESEVALPTYRDRLQAMRPVTMDVDPRMVLAPPPSADVNLLDRRALLSTPASQLPSYQDGTDYVPQTGPAIVHEGEMIVPADQADKLRKDVPSIITVKAKRLSEDEVKKRWVALGYPAASAEGIARNVIRESGGDPEIIGDDDTSGGLFQHHASRLTDLKAYAREQGKPWTDPDVQIAFADKELKDKFPALRKSLMENRDPAVAEDAFKRIFERPASVMWENTASGQPVLGTSRYRFSDYALGEHDGRRGTSLMYMDPQDYLDLSPDLAGDPSTSRSGKALRASVGRGDEIEGVPSLDIRANGPTGVVTAQDGRHRALLAQEEGVDAIPVAINQKGAGQPTEIQGMTGKVLPFDFKPASEVTRQASPIGQMLGQTVASVTPAAGDLPAWGSSDQVVESGTPTWGANDAVVDQGAPPAAPSTWESFKTGLLDLPVGAAQLVGNVAGGLGGFLPGKQGEEARDFTNRLNAAVAAREGRYEEGRGPDAGVDWARLGGNVVGSVPLSALGAVGAGGGLAARLGGAAVAGGLGSSAQPVTEGPFWQGKGGQAAVGAAAGGTLGALGAGMARTLGPAIGSAARKLMNEGVVLTPGQMAGGATKRAEDAMMSIPILGSSVRAARQRSLETFNTAAINRSLADIGGSVPKGVVGHDAIAAAQQQFSQAYDAVVPRMQGTEDQQLRADLLNVVARATNENLPQEYMQELHHIIGSEIVSRFNAGGGRITGTDAQAIGTRLDELRTPLRMGNVYQQHLGRLLNDVDKAMDTMMERNNPTLQPIKDRIDAGYSKFKIVQNASRYAGTSPDGTFTPAQLNQAVLARDRSKDKAAFARGDALMQDLAIAAKDVLPAKVPDSGTPERLMMMDMLRNARDVGAGAGAYYFSPFALGGLGLGALAYTRMGLAGINAAAKSPATKNFLANLGRGSGTLGALTAPRGDVQFDIQSITPGGPPSPQPGP